MGDGKGEWPLSEFSVADDSAPGEDVFHPEKNDVSFWPGVLGGLRAESVVSVREGFLMLRSTWRGGGFVA
jgi:hypothetical protein